MTAAVRETTIERNAIASTRNVTPMMKSRKIGIRSMIWSAMSLKAAVWPETYATASPPAIAAGTTSPRSRSTSSSVASSCGADVGRDEDDRDGLRVVELRLADRGDALEPLHAVVDPLRRLLVAVDVDDDRDRPVEAGPEALREQVVRPAARLLERLRALVGGAEAHEPGRPGEDEAGDQQHREDDLRVRGHEPAPAGDERLLAGLLGVVDRADERHLQPVDLVAEQRQHRDQQRVRDQDRRQHAERAADPELRDEVEADEREARRPRSRRSARRRSRPGRQRRRPPRPRRRATAPRGAAV